LLEACPEQDKVWANQISAGFRSAAEAELQAIGPTDDIERAQAAERLAKLPPDRQVWGLPPMIKREPQVDYKVSG